MGNGYVPTGRPPGRPPGPPKPPPQPRRVPGRLPTLREMAGAKTDADVETCLAHLTQKEIAEIEGYIAQEEPTFVDEKFPEQAALVQEQERFRAVLCTRRAGKTAGVIRTFCEDQKTHPGANYIYCGITLESARLAAWKDGFQKIDREMALGLRFNETHSTVTFPNGAIVYLVGMDKPEQLDKARGGRFRGADVDEAQKFQPRVLLSLVMDILRPALKDDMGFLLLSGTPGPVPKGLFHDLTCHCDPRTPARASVKNLDTAAAWAVHCWNTDANPYMREQNRADIEAMIAVNPRIVETPTFRRENLGLWEQDESSLVYRYQTGRNDFDGKLPTFADKKGEWHHVLGVDLGWEDATAFVVGAYHDYEKVLYFTESESAPGLDFTDTAERIKEYRSRYDFDAIVIDGANKQGVEEMRRRHELPLEAAEKKDKFEFIDLMNADFIKERIRLDPEKCAGMVEEYAGLVLDPRKLNLGRRAEHPDCANHQLDAALYAWRECYHYTSAAPQKPAAFASREWEQEMERRAMERAERQALGQGEDEDPLARILEVEL